MCDAPLNESFSSIRLHHSEVQRSQTISSFTITTSIRQICNEEITRFSPVAFSSPRPLTLGVVGVLVPALPAMSISVFWSVSEAREACTTSDLCCTSTGQGHCSECCAFFTVTAPRDRLLCQGWSHGWGQWRGEGRGQASSQGRNDGGGVRGGAQVGQSCDS